MGVVSAYSACCLCHQPFFYNPMRVPSVRVNGEREPICEPCMTSTNALRVANGLAPFEILSGAYEACDESELSDGE